MSVILKPGWYVCHVDCNEENGDYIITGVIKKCSDKETAKKAAERYKIPVMALYFNGQQWHVSQ